MTFNANLRRTMTAIGMAATATALPVSAQAQVTTPISDAEVSSLPPEYRAGPVLQNSSETTVGADGVETITRTRRIDSTTSYPAQTGSYADFPQGYAPAQYAPVQYAPATVLERDQWIAECEDRTRGRGNREKGGIIGGLLGAIAGGVLGNRLANGDRLAGTLVGGGVGGIAGIALANLIGGGRDKNGNYDCEAALDGYLSQYGTVGAVPTPAARTIPVQSYAVPTYAAPVQYGYAPAYNYSYAPPQQIVYVPIRYEQQQRVIVRETVREETVPGAARQIRPVPVRPAEPRYIKGN